MGNEDLWHGPFAQVKDKLRLCISVCERWVGVCEQLTSHFWKRYAPNPWKGEIVVPTSVSNLYKRLSEVGASAKLSELKYDAFSLVVSSNCRL